ncbi:undecaprenyl-diphosphate phosphatase [uncultured Jatrophihabitans sp.]|uniref:undecaprenyl-diphosphate phosphatase n=1 Tax=uncultured Jatrophihabitans sp. TaxID=1610747 RepID=UPI0035CB676C
MEHRHDGPVTHLSWLEAGVVGAFQGVSELFPVSSLGHSVLIPAIVGGSWQRDLDVRSPESPYLAFIVGLHVATALALIIYFRRDWALLMRGLYTSVRHRRIREPEERLIWLLILATIPVGIAGLLLEHTFRTHLATPTLTAIFLIVNGVLLELSQRLQRRRPQTLDDTEVDVALSQRPVGQSVLVGAAQVAALAPGISRSGITMAAGVTAGWGNQQAARFSFLLATPVILAAGVLKVPDLFGPLGDGIRGQVLFGSVLSGIGAYVAVRFLDRWFANRTLRPYALYCVVAGIVALVLVRAGVTIL